MLTRERIQQLASKKGVKAIAVQNFLGSLGGSSYQDAMANLEMDARSYGWNTATQSAIRAGILENFQGAEKARQAGSCSPCEAAARARAAAAAQAARRTRSRRSRRRRTCRSASGQFRRC
jgi:hypothetical protein